MQGAPLFLSFGSRNFQSFQGNATRCLHSFNLYGMGCGEEEHSTWGRCRSRLMELKDNIKAVSNHHNIKELSVQQTRIHWYIYKHIKSNLHSFLVRFLAAKCSSLAIFMILPVFSTDEKLTIILSDFLFHAKKARFVNQPIRTQTFYTLR